MTRSERNHTLELLLNAQRYFLYTAKHGTELGRSEALEKIWKANEIVAELFDVPAERLKSLPGIEQESRELDELWQLWSK